MLNDLSMDVIETNESYDKDEFIFFKKGVLLVIRRSACINKEHRSKDSSVFLNRSLGKRCYSTVIAGRLRKFLNLIKI